MDYRGQHPRRTTLRTYRWILGCSLLLGVMVLDVRSASPHTDEVAGIALRGPGAMIRSRLDSARELLAEGRATEARERAESLLGDLRLRMESAEEPLDVETLREAAREAVTVRNAAIAWLTPFPSGFRGEFLASVVDGATFHDWMLGVPAAISLAQAILESDWGRSAPGYNLFGLKGEGTAGSLQRRVVEYRRGRRIRVFAPFRAYHAAEEAMLDHAEILARGARYARAREASEDHTSYARALQGTYATDPRYAKKLVRIIEGLGLGRFDWVQGAPVDATRPKPTPVDTSAPVALAKND